MVAARNATYSSDRKEGEEGAGYSVGARASADVTVSAR